MRVKLLRVCEDLLLTIQLSGFPSSICVCVCVYLKSNIAKRGWYTYTAYHNCRKQISFMHLQHPSRNKQTKRDPGLFAELPLCVWNSQPHISNIYISQRTGSLTSVITCPNYDLYTLPDPLTALSPGERPPPTLPHHNLRLRPPKSLPPKVFKT